MGFPEPAFSLFNLQNHRLSSMSASQFEHEKISVFKAYRIRSLKRRCRRKRLNLPPRPYQATITLRSVRLLQGLQCRRQRLRPPGINGSKLATRSGLPFCPSKQQCDPQFSTGSATLLHILTLKRKSELLIVSTLL